MDQYGIDSHKIMYHPERLAEWRSAGDDWEKLKRVYPLYVEISPCGACNSRCAFCAFDYLGYKPTVLETGKTKQILVEMSIAGVKSVMFGGEGEPLLHPDMAELAVSAKKCGLDVSFTTNGIALTENFLERALPSISWIKVSLNAGTPETYHKVHQIDGGNFNRVVENLKNAVKIKKEKNINCRLGAQMVLVPENAHEVVSLAKLMKEIGLDYFVVKPYTHHDLSLTRQYKAIKYEPYSKLGEELAVLSDKNFSAVFRGRTMKKWDEGARPYKFCRATPFFWTFLASNGDLYGCSVFLGDERFVCGNINQSTFADIWESEARKKIWENMKNKFDISRCCQNCRMDEINRYLWRLKDDPPEHVNFI